jgi:hypothetical protein
VPDRLLQHSTVVSIQGAGYRLKDKRRAGLIHLPAGGVASRSTNSSEWSASGSPHAMHNFPGRFGCRSVVSLGPTVGAVITILLAEILRIGFGTKAVGWDNLVYGVLLVVFIIFLPKGILGSILDKLKTQRRRQTRRINE